MKDAVEKIRRMTLEDILAFEKASEVTIDKHCLKLTDIKVIREFRRPDNMTENEFDAAGDGDVLVILDLRPDESLFEAGVAREIVNRIQKLRKKAALEPTDMVEVYYNSLDEDKSISQKVLNSQELYIKDVLGFPLLSANMIPSHSVILGEETFTDVINMAFVISLARPTLVFNSDDILSLYDGNEKYAQALQIYLMCRDHSVLKSEFHFNSRKITVDCIEKQPAVHVVLGKHLFLSVGDYHLSGKSWLLPRQLKQ